VRNDFLLCPESGEGNAVERAVSCRPIFRPRQPNDPPLQVRLVPSEGELFVPAYPFVDTDDNGRTLSGTVAKNNVGDLLVFVPPQIGEPSIVLLRNRTSRAGLDVTFPFSISCVQRCG
jgi:hypothetical protein